MTKKKLLTGIFCYLAITASTSQNSELQESEDQIAHLIQIIASQDAFSCEAKKTAFNALKTMCIKTEPHHISYCEPEEIIVVPEIPAHIYEQIIQSMPICCVDTFVYHFEKRAYLMIQRTAPPAKGLWWMPGGRVLKGESFYESAIRKVKIESGLDICPIAKLSTYSTYFPESAWGVHTDTKNTVILALCDNEYVANTEHLDAFQWVPIEEAPSDPYMFSAYKRLSLKRASVDFEVLLSQISLQNRGIIST